MKNDLDVYLHDTLVGILTQEESGELEFTYDKNHLASGGGGISLSLPLGEIFSSSFSNDFFKGKYRGKRVEAFFSGLLPDESIRIRLAKNLGISSSNSFSLLEVVGGDCAGALSLYPQGTKPPATNEGDVEVLDDAKLVEILDLLKNRPMLAGDNGYRLSLAGAQHKLAVGFKNGRVLLHKGGMPTTHILKPLIDRVVDSVHNELFCMKLAKMMHLDVPEVSIHSVKQIPFYLIERYDRKIAKSGMVERIHQEDFCQALGIMPSFKYQREGGPDVTKCLELINQNFSRPVVNQIKFLHLIIFNYLIGNSDAHGKNFSLIYVGNKPELAPAYDLMSTAIYPDLHQNMAMKIGGKYRPNDVFLRHFQRLVPDTKAAQATLNDQINYFKSNIIEAATRLKSVLEADGICSNVFNDIIEVIKLRAEFVVR